MKRKITPRNKRTPKRKLYGSKDFNRKGACCLGYGKCKSGLNTKECTGLGGFWMGANSYCRSDFPLPNNGILCAEKKQTDFANNKTGSCCYYDENDNRAKCEDDITFYQCKDKNKGKENHWSRTNRCKNRIAAKHDLCCNTCGKKSKDPETRRVMEKIKKSSTTFRSRINEKTNDVSLTSNEKCKNKVNVDYVSRLKSITHNNLLSAGEQNDVSALIKILGLERCETCQSNTNEKLTPSLRSYYGCICTLNKEKENELISAFNKLKNIISGTESSQDDLALHKEVDQIIEKFRDREIFCNNLINDENTGKAISEKKEGCCCQYTKSGKNEQAGVLKRCSTLTKRQCSKIRKYKTVWRDCSAPGCDKTCVAGNQPGKCASCEAGSGGNVRTSPTRANTQTSTTTSSTPSQESSAPAPQSSPSISPPPSSGGGYGY